jgi:hypothetical protein
MPIARSNDYIQYRLRRRKLRFGICSGCGSPCDDATMHGSWSVYFLLLYALEIYQSLQGLLPTAMLIYVGLNLGVNTEEVTNSFRPAVYMRDESQFGQGEGRESLNWAYMTMQRMQTGNANHVND